jgi:cytochrome P450
MHYVHPARRPLGSDYLQNPHDVHTRLRESLAAAPVALPSGNKGWMVTRYDDVRAALADPRLPKDPSRVGGGHLFSSNMLNTDPPDHQRLRRLVAAAFTMRRVERLRPRIEEITTELLDAMAGHDEVDLLDAFAFPLPITVICELLGIPVDDRDDFRTWTGLMLSSTSSGADAHAAALAMAAYFSSLIEDRRREPSEDMVSALIAARDDEDRLTEDELRSMLWLLLVAGHETTVNLIASGTLALLTHPGELKRLRDDPDLMPAAVEELLRYTSPVNHGTFRFTACPVTYDNVIVPEREQVLVMIASANHDPSRFPSPDALDLGRDTGGHLAFGHGIHFCLGAPLARMEAVIAFRELLARFPGLALAVPAESLRWRESTLIRGLEQLPVRLTAN